MRRHWLLPIALAVLILASFLAWRNGVSGEGGGDEESDPEGETETRSWSGERREDDRAPKSSPSLARKADREPGPSGTERLQEQLADIERASLTEDREQLLKAARRLRALLIENPGLLAEAKKALANPENATALRRALGVVMGSLPGGDGQAAVLEVLKSGVGADLQRSLVLSLNIVPEESPPLFRRDGHPYSMEAAPGLVVFVRGPVEDSEARQVLRGLLGSADQEVRLAATRVLRDSLSFAGVREAMREILSRSGEDAEVGAEAAAALGHWAKRRSVPADERSEVIDELLGALPESGELLRFRLTDPLTQAPLAEEQRAQLRALARDSENEGLRRSAAEILGRRLAAATPQERAQTLPLLSWTVASDPSPMVRETSARALRQAAGDPEAARTLMEAARSDADPEVRAAAVASLGAFDFTDEAGETIRILRQSDPDPLVRAAAERALGGR